MPAVSPTMNEGKILKWKISPGESFTVGDALFSIETDKAVVDYEATEKGVLAKIIAKDNEALLVGKNVAVIVKSKDQVTHFADFVEGSAPAPKASQQPSENNNQPA